MPSKDRIGWPSAARNYYSIIVFTKEIVDFTGLTNEEILGRLRKLNIPLTAQEALKIQNEMLSSAFFGRAYIIFDSRLRAL